MPSVSNFDESQRRPRKPDNVLDLLITVQNVQGFKMFKSHCASGFCFQAQRASILHFPVDSNQKNVHVHKNNIPKVCGDGEYVLPLQSKDK